MVKKKVIILTNTLLNGGAEKQAVILGGLFKEHYPTQLIVYYGNQTDSRLELLIEKYNIDTIRLTGSHLKKLITIFNIFKSNRSSVVFSYLATTNVINGIIGKLAGVKGRIGGIRSSKTETKKMIIQRFIHNHLLHYSVFNCESGMKNMIARGFNLKKTIYIPNCIKMPEHFKTNTNENVSILSVGRFVVAKDYLTSLKVFQRCYEQNKNINYTIIGYGELESNIRQWIKDLDLLNGVELVINPPDVMDYYLETDIYLCTSIFEGTSNSDRKTHV